MRIEGITLKTGELALPGYTLVTGSLLESTYFRFTIPEKKLKAYQTGSTIKVSVPYLDNKSITGTIKQVKLVGAYANIATAYPDYDMQESLYEVIVKPQQPEEAAKLYTKSTVILAP